MGHVAGSEIDGRTIAYDLSLEGMLSQKKDFIGKRSLTRKAFTENDREKIVGVVPIDKKTSIPEGSYLVENENPNAKLRSNGKRGQYYPTRSKQIQGIVVHTAEGGKKAVNIARYL